MMPHGACPRFERFRFFSFLLWLGCALLTARLCHVWIFDPDPYWLVRDGQVVLEKGHLPEEDSYSYTVQGLPFIHNDILTKVLFAIIHGRFGLGGLVIFRTIFCALALILCTLTYSATWLWRGAMLPFLFVAIFSRFLMTGELFTIALIILIVRLLQRYDTHGGRGIFIILPPLFVVWANLHNGYQMGLILALAYTAGMVIERALRHSTAARLADIVAMLLSLTISLVLIAVINPYGPRFLSDTVTRHFSGEYPLAVRTIQHFASDFQWQFPESTVYIALLCLLTLFLTLYRLGGARLSLGSWLMVLSFALLSYSYPRRAPQYLALLLSLMVLQVVSAPGFRESGGRTRAAALGCTLACAGILMMVIAPRVLQQGPSVERPSMDLSPFLNLWCNRLPPNRWFASMGIESQLILKAPEHKTFYDGRILPFLERIPPPLPPGTSVLGYEGSAKPYASIYNVGRTIEAEVEQGNLESPIVEWASTTYGIRTVLVSNELDSAGPLLPRLFLADEAVDWRLVHGDQAVLVWMRAADISPATRTWILSRLAAIQPPAVLDVTTVVSSVIARQLGDLDLAARLVAPSSARRQTSHAAVLATRQRCRIARLRGNPGEAARLARDARGLASLAARGRLPEEIAPEGELVAADCMLCAGQPDAAVPLLLDLVANRDITTGPETFLYLIRAYVALGDLNRARAAMASGLTAFPEHPLLLSMTATLEMRPRPGDGFPHSRVP